MHTPKKKLAAVDWRTEKDRCYFFFKDSNTHSILDINNTIPDGYPSEVKPDNRDDFHSHVKQLQFGFSTTGVKPTRPGISGIDSNILWLF